MPISKSQLPSRAGCLLLACLILVAGCSSSPYPAGWSPPLPDAGPGCAGVTGTFENLGVSSKDDRVAMAMLFFPLKPSEKLLLMYERFAVTKVAITFSDESTLSIRGLVEDELLFERQLTGEAFECRDQHLVLRTSNWGIDSTLFVPVVHRTSAEHLLSRAEDGSLIIENHQNSGGLAVVVPVAARLQQWFRFQPSPATRSPAESARLPRGVRESPPPMQALRPPDGTPDWSGYERAKRCLASARQNIDGPLPADPALLDGRSSQAFLLQGLDGGMSPEGEVSGNDWYPVTHDLRVEKQHREAPELADRYVLCLLAQGYRFSED